ncbi:uncharacterized protein SRS1_12651 [Sporisorium reilianum f. sp. reilianum]|uniref:Uncharacterized protein n=1 Tax=Sporisorium reilianum f. sp. reilianum TaxID=72559 RepID=A0A2N8U9E1_9BASI|nr:uncharacterized protein SRS1_12651 [Sporisorium reilianum f. sp. reilianum]
MAALRPKLVASTLSDAQARQVLHTIGFPGFEDQQQSHQAAQPPATLRTLSLLQIHFLLTFPFEALAMNYEPGAHMSSDPSDVFSRFVEQRLGGGYCLQVNPLYRELLSWLGFRHLGVLGRVWSPSAGSWSGLTHTTTLVYMDSHVEGEEGRKVYYVSDVGYGSSPPRPILLRDGWEEYGRGLSEKFRLVHRVLQPRSTLEPSEDDDVDAEIDSIARAQSVWILQQSKRDTWHDCYSFSPHQCFDADYHASNRATSHPAAVPFATMILVVRYLLHPPSAAHTQHDALHPALYPYHPSAIEQRMVVDDTYIVKLGDETLVSRKIASEEERVRLLKREFGLLSHVDTQAALQTISGKPSKLKTTAEKANGTSGSHGSNGTAAH